MAKGATNVKWVFIGVFLSITLVAISVSTDVTQLLKIRRTEIGRSTGVQTTYQQLEEVDWYSDDPYAVGDQRTKPSPVKHTTLPVGDSEENTEDDTTGETTETAEEESAEEEVEDLVASRAVVQPGTLSSEEVKSAFRSAVRYGLKGVNMSFYPRFKAAQIQLVRAVKKLRNESLPQEQRVPLRLLVVVTVSSKLSSVASFVEWVEYFRKVQKRQKSQGLPVDTFHFALNHYDNTLSNWYDCG